MNYTLNFHRLIFENCSRTSIANLRLPTRSKKIGQESGQLVVEICSWPLTNIRSEHVRLGTADKPIADDAEEEPVALRQPRCVDEGTHNSRDPTDPRSACSHLPSCNRPPNYRQKWNAGNRSSPSISTIRLAFSFLRPFLPLSSPWNKTFFPNFDNSIFFQRPKLELPFRILPRIFFERSHWNYIYIYICIYSGKKCKKEIFLSQDKRLIGSSCENYF